MSSDHVSPSHFAQKLNSARKRRLPPCSATKFVPNSSDLLLLYYMTLFLKRCFDNVNWLPKTSEKCIVRGENRPSYMAARLSFLSAA